MKLLASKWCGDYRGTYREGREEERQSEREKNLSWDPEVRVNLWTIKSLEVCKAKKKRDRTPETPLSPSPPLSSSPQIRGPLCPIVGIICSSLSC